MFRKVKWDNENLNIVKELLHDMVDIVEMQIDDEKFIDFDIDI